jgi:hypothetical protein
MPELDASDFFSSVGAFVSAGAVGVEDDEEVPELEEPELPQPAIPNAIKTAPSVVQWRGPVRGRPSDDFVNMKPPWWCVVAYWFRALPIPRLPTPRTSE